MAAQVYSDRSAGTCWKNTGWKNTGRESVPDGVRDKLVGDQGQRNGGIERTEQALTRHHQLDLLRLVVGAGQSFSQRAELQAEVDTGEFLVSIDLLMNAAHDVDSLADDLHPCAGGRMVDLHGFKLDQTP